MQQTLFQEKYPVLVVEIEKTETDLGSMSDVVDYFRDKITSNPEVKLIGEFDHHEHTSGIGGEISPEIGAAVNLVFCFGKVLTSPLVMAVRPRSLAIADLGDRFTVSFLEAPMPAANETMTAWVLGMRRAA
jgi:hypothetical protein